MNPRSANPPPEVHNFRGFDPTSQTMLVMIASGSCLGEFVPAGAATSFDTEVAPRSGELAVIMISLPGRPGFRPASLGNGDFIVNVKQLELIDGKWFTLSFDGIHELAPNFEVIGKVVQIVLFAHCSSIDPRAPHVIEGETIAYRDHQAHMRSQVLPRLAARGFNRKAVYPLSRNVASRLPASDRLS